MTATETEPREEFWTRYNRRMEFPLSAAAAVVIHVAVAVLILAAIGWLMNSPSKSEATIQFVPEVEGLDDDGVGSPGGGEPDALKGREELTAPDLLPRTPDLPDVQESRPKPDLPEGAVPVPVPKADWGKADGAIPKKPAGDPEKKSGSGGDGKDTTKARSQRWVLRFTTADGRDYLDQLAAMKAQILIPVPPGNKKFNFYPDLKDTAKGGEATERDLEKLTGLVRFNDSREESVASVCKELKSDLKPKEFYAFFPKATEEELLKKEVGYRNRRVEDIKETIFRITVKDGKVQIEVVDQSVKK